jgi:hypothetical protein
VHWNVKNQVVLLYGSEEEKTAMTQELNGFVVELSNVPTYHLYMDAKSNRNIRAVVNRLRKIRDLTFGK